MNKDYYEHTLKVIKDILSDCTNYVELEESREDVLVIIEKALKGEHIQGYSKTI